MPRPSCRDRDAGATGTRSSRPAIPASYLQLSGWAAVKAVNGWTAADRTSPERTGTAAAAPDRRPDPPPPAAPAAVGVRLRAARSGRRRLDARGDRRLHGRRPARPRRRRRPRLPPPDRPRDRARRAARSGRGAPARRSGPPAGDPPTPIQPNATRIIDLRADEEALLGRPAQEVAPVRQQGTDGGHHGRRRGRRPALPEFYRIYRETADRAGLPDPGRAGLSRRLGGVRAGRQRPAAVRPGRRRRAAGDAVPRALRAARRRAVRRHDRGRRASRARTTCSSGRRSGSSREAGRDELRPVGPRHRRDRPFQDRASAAARSATSARGTSSSIRSVGRPTSVAQRGRVSGGRGGVAALAPGRRPARPLRGGRLTRPIRRRRRPSSADWDARAVDAPGGHVYQSRAWAEHRAGPRLDAALPRRSTTAFGRSPCSRRWPSGRRLERLRAARPGPPMRRRRDRRQRADRRSPSAGGASGRRRRRGRPRGARRGRGVSARDRGGRLPRRSRRSSRRATASRSPLGRPDRGRRLRRHLEVDPPADPEGGGDRPYAWSATTRRARRERPGRRLRAPERAGRGRARPLLRPAARDRASGASSASGLAAAFVGWWRAAHRGRPPRLPRGARRRRTATARRPGPVPPRRTPLDRPLRRPRRRTASDAPGALHLLRWRAIQLAIREGRAEMDLGGVDVAGARGEPDEGEPMYGLYQHKRSFGGRWVELTGAHERVYRSAAATGWAGWREPHGRDDRPMTDRTIAGLAGRRRTGPGPRRSAGSSTGSTARGPAPRRPARRPRDRAGRPGRHRGPGVTDDSRGGPAGRAVRGGPRAPRRRPRLRRAPPRRRRRGRARRAARAGVALPQLVVDARRSALAAAAAWWYGDPSRELGVVGITGTDGKTTTSFLAVGGARGGRASDRADRDGRDPDRRGPRAEPRAHDDARRRPSSSGPSRAMVDRRRRRRRRRDDVARAGARAGRRDRLRRRDPDQPHPRAPRVPRHVGGVSRRQAVAVRAPRVGPRQPAQGARRPAWPKAGDRQRRRPDRRRRSSASPRRPAPGS